VSSFKTPRQEIKKLKKQASRLEKQLDDQRRENADLKRQIAEVKGAYGSLDRLPIKGRKRHPVSPGSRQAAQELLGINAFNAGRFSKKSYARYLIQTFKGSTLGMIFRRISRFFRRFRLIRRITAVVAAILVGLLLSAFFVTILPFLLLLLIMTLMGIAMRARSANRRMKEELRHQKRIRVVIFSDQVTFEGDTFGERSAKAMASSPDTTVLVVTPRLWSTKGLGGQGMFFTVRQEAERLYLVRRGYYFILRRRVLDSLSCDISVIY